MRTHTRILIAALLPLLAGCASTPSKYYTLDMRPSGGATAGVNISIDFIRVADTLAGKNIMIQQSPTQVEYYEGAGWSSTLDDLVREKLLTEFGDPVEGRKALILAGTLSAFSQVDAEPKTADAYVKFQASIRAPDKSRYDKPLLEKTYEATLRAESATPDDIVIALSRCVETIASQIAADAAGL